MTDRARPTALIADDEPALRKHLQRLLADVWPELEVVAAVGDGAAALMALAELQPQVAFLDIRMPGASGLEVAHAAQGTAVVFVTAYDEFALEAFRHAAVDYLLKPVAAVRLEETVGRLRARLDRGAEPALTADVLQTLMNQLQPRAHHLDWLRVGKGDEVTLVPVDDVCFFQADRKYTSAMTRDGEHLVRTSISELTEQLDPERFWRIHRSTVVAVAAIASAKKDLRGRYRLTLKERPEVLTVSGAHAHLFRQM